MNSFPLNLGIIDLPKEIISRIAEYPFYPFRKLKSTRDAFYRTDSASDNFSDQPDPNVPPTPYQVTFDSELVGDPKTNLYREELFVNEDFVLPLNPGGTVFSRKRVARLKESNSKPGGKHPTKSPPSSDKKEAEETFNILNDLSDILKCESTQYSNNDPSMGEPYSKSQSFNNSHRKTDSAVELQIDDSCSTTSSSSYSSSSTSTSTPSSRLSFPPFSSYSPFRIMKYLPLPIPSSRWQPQPTPSPSSAFQTTPQHSHESLHIETRTPLLFIHGFVQNRFAFGAPTNIRPTSILSYLASHGYDVFYFDLRGSRDSIRLGCELPRTLMEYVTHDIPAALSFLRRIRKEEKRKKGVEYDEAEKVVLVGFSMGCILASAYAGINPQDVLGIIQIAGLYEARDSPSIFHNAIGRIVKSIPSVLDPFRLPYHFMLSSIPQLKKLLDNPVNPIAGL
ncbi:Alpha/Beta hydrolase protein [Paraphysoderma sedebokerense]|nr:Alpha/Beta hydrolase protein [Paraphysoderma sedebokerense]